MALVFIVVTGAAVRLTGSGLGCPDWPTCDGDQIVSEFRETPEIIEFVNRMITGLVSVAVAAAVLGSLRRTPRRRDLTLLSWGLVAGVVAQIVLGGVTVLLELTPPAVMAHFLLSMALVADAVVLHHRAGEPDVGVRRPDVTPSTLWSGLGHRDRDRHRHLRRDHGHRDRARTAATPMSNACPSPSARWPACTAPSPGC